MNAQYENALWVPLQIIFKNNDQAWFTFYLSFSKCTVWMLKASLLLFFPFLFETGIISFSCYVSAQSMSNATRIWTHLSASGPSIKIPLHCENPNLPSLSSSVAFQENFRWIKKIQAKRQRKLQWFLWIFPVTFSHAYDWWPFRLQSLSNSMFFNQIAFKIMNLKNSPARSDCRWDDSFLI